MPSKREVIDAAGQLVSRQWYDDNGTEITEAQATTLAATEQQIKDALDIAIAGMEALIGTANIPSGTRTTAELSNYCRELQAAVKDEARAIRRLAKYVRGDFTGSA